MFPIWKDACSPVQPLRTVILDLHGTAVAVDLDMSSLLNIAHRSGGTSSKHVDLTKSCWTRRLRCQVSSARARLALTPWLTLRSTYRLRPHTLERLCRAYGKVENKPRVRCACGKHTANNKPLVVACREALTNTHLFTFALWARTLLRVSSSSVCLGP